MGDYHRLTTDCGGGCLLCMAMCGDADAMDEVVQFLSERRKLLWPWKEFKDPGLGPRVGKIGSY
jgi:hypothetical protein